MTSLGTLVKGHGFQVVPLPFDLDAVARDLNVMAVTSSATVAQPLGTLAAITAALTAWIHQDDDAHEPCSLTACRAPLHPGPCKGWKGTLHSVSPHIWKQVEDERVAKANARRVKRIADLRSQGKPIPRRLLTEIKPKPAPGTGSGPTHPATGATATPLGKVNQQADLAGGQAHNASQAINQAAGVVPNTANLPKGPTGKKPTVAGRGPAFVITQPKVTDTYKLDKAAKLTPQEWNALSPGDRKLIRDELEAIKVRGFGPQQKKADALLAQLPAGSTLGSTAAPAVPQIGVPHPQKPAAAPGKTTLGQATKTVSAPAPSAAGPHGSRSQASTSLAITEAIHGKQSIDLAKLTDAFDNMKSKGDLKDSQAFKLLVDRLANNALKRAAADKMPGLGHGTNDVGITDFNHQIRDHILDGKPGLPPVIQKMKDHHESLKSAPKAPAAPTPAPPAAPKAPSPAPAATPQIGIPRATAGPTPQAPGAPSNTPKAFPPHVQHARAVAGRALGGRPTAKVHLDTYGKLTKDDFDSLDATTQKTIRDDLANASAKFLDPKKKQAARDLLDRFGSRHPAPAGTSNAPTHVDDIKIGDKFTDQHGTYVITETPAQGKIKGFRMTSTAHGGREVTSSEAQMARDFGLARGPRTAAPATHPKGYSDPQDQAVKAATGGAPADDVLKAVARLTPGQVGKLDDADKRSVLTRLAFIATHPKATDVQKERATAYGRIFNKGPLATPAKGDHEPSLGELHAHETSTGAAQKAAALDAVHGSKMDVNDQLKALGGLTKAQFDSLTPDEQRQITDTLQELHRNRIHNGGKLDVDAAVIKAIETYTGMHPALYRLKQAEADFKAGKISGDTLHNQFLSARVQAPATTHKAVRLELEKEAARIARANPTLPTYARVRLAGERQYNATTYPALGLAGMKHMWDPAPRMSQSDFTSLFRATDDDLKAVDPIHAQAIRDLREHILKTGLGFSSPWSDATKNQAVDAFLGINGTTPEMTRDRLAAFKAMPDGIQSMVRSTVRKRLAAQTNDRAKTTTWVALRELEGEPQLLGTTRDAVLSAIQPYSSGKMDAYRRLDPVDFAALPDFTRRGIHSDLDKLQQQLTARGATHVWTSSDNPLKVLPAALSAHLAGNRLVLSDRDARNVSDISNYGRDIVAPASRVEAYNKLTPVKFQGLSPLTQKDVTDDLDKIENDASLPLQTRYDAAMNQHVFLKTGSQIGLTVSQLSAVQGADMHPSSMYSNAAAFGAFNNLSKADYDALSPTFRAAIDERAKGLPGADQQVLTAKFHPAAPAANLPSGMAPTPAQANVPAHVQDALDTIYGVHPKSHTMAHQLETYGTLRGSDFNDFNVQEQQQLLSDLSYIATTAKGPSADKAKKLIDRFTPAGTPSGQTPANPAIIPPANSVPGQTRYATPLKGLSKAANSGQSGDGWLSLPGGKRVWGHYGAAGLLIKHTDPNSGEERYLMVQRGPAISDPGKWTFPGGASDSLETPHQGATRETIEELGLKDDQFKDALVHGDHVYSVPGSNWKYTTVAASVPTMFKPDLSSHHARLETSDAKWMTLAEIKALDSSGKLHGPIAGGLLEKNVISLYPSGAPAGGGKLGQVARPGPVTKRPDRMTLPSGGRQAPATFNAWPHAHKPSTGKNLVGSKAEIDAQRQKIKKDRVLYDGKTADGRLAAIGAQQGFDDTPTVVSKSEIDRLLATGDYIEAWRGVSGAGGWSARGRGNAGGKTAEQINEEMRTGPAYYGKGIFGNGYYLATQKDVAEQYSDHSTGSVVRILIPKSALTDKYDRVEREAQANSSRTSKAKGSSGYEVSTFWDPGRWAAAKGLDGIEINPHHRSAGGGGARHVAAQGKPAFNWLNRSVLILQKEPG